MTVPSQLDLTGGLLDVRVNVGDGEAFSVPLPADLTTWVWAGTGGVVITVTASQFTVRIPAAVTAALTTSVAYSVTVTAPGGEPQTLIRGRLIPT